MANVFFRGFCYVNSACNGVKMLPRINGMAYNNVGFKSTQVEQKPNSVKTPQDEKAWKHYLDEKEEDKHDELNKKNNILTKTAISYDKLMNAVTTYPAKGLKGDKNANFYEFLTMGTVPYLIGSATLMTVFNAASKHYESFARSRASVFGKKAALGVLFYALALPVAKAVIDAPIRWITGVDVEMPYTKSYKALPNLDGSIPTANEHHKVFESVEFTRWDLLYGDPKKGEARNQYFDKIAKKNGWGENLKDSDQEVKPRIREIAIQSKLVKNIAPYLWAGTAVGLAFQECWDGFFKVKQKTKLDTIKAFGRSLKESFGQMYNGTDKLSKIGGRAMILGTLAVTAIGIGRVLQNNSKASKIDASDVIDKNEKYVVS